MCVMPLVKPTHFAVRTVCVPFTAGALGPSPRLSGKVTSLRTTAGCLERALVISTVYMRNGFVGCTPHLGGAV